MLYAVNDGSLAVVCVGAVGGLSLKSSGLGPWGLGPWLVGTGHSAGVILQGNGYIYGGMDKRRNLNAGKNYRREARGREAIIRRSQNMSQFGMEKFKLGFCGGGRNHRVMDY